MPGTQLDRYDLALRGANDGLWDWDLSSRRIRFSPRWISMLGCDESELGNTPEEWFKRIHPEDRESVQHDIDAHLESGSLQFTMQHRMLHKDGSYRWMSCHGVITRDEGGQALRISGLHSDITAEKVVDALTGLPNRILFLNRLTRAIGIANRHSDFLFAVLILDLDGSQSLDDRLGSAGADLLVVASARRLETCLRVEGTMVRPGCDHVVARLDRDEFIILLEGLERVGEAKIVAERLLKAISAPFEINGREVFLSASIGIALSATGYRDAEDALRDAYIALHRAKSLGKRRCEIFDTAILQSAQARLALQADLQEAVRRQELSLAYQPIVSLSSSRIAGFEVLLRWNHPLRGMVSPAEFIPIAEQTGLIVPLGRWVLQEACHQLRVWRVNLQIAREMWVSVNLSSRQLRQPSLTKDVQGILLDADLDADGLILELTESGIMENPEAARTVLMQLRVMGVRISLDDFGTGYSSLAHLRRFPLDFLKLDRSFVRGIENNEEAGEIVRAIGSLAHQLGLCVIAEGIETPRQLDMIRSFGFEYGQGFLFSRPVDKEKAEALLISGSKLGEATSDRTMTDDGDSEADLCSPAAPLHFVPDEFRIKKERTSTLSRRPLLSGLAAILLLAAGILVAKLSVLPPSPVAYSPPPRVPGAAEAQGKYISRMQPAEKTTLPPTEATDPEPNRADSSTARRASPASVYSYMVVHDHVFGNCKGTLTITRDTLSYAPETGDDGFQFAYSECSFVLEQDQLTIKGTSRTYHFKSATSKTKEENRTQLQRIVRSISKFHPESAVTRQ